MSKKKKKSQNNNIKSVETNNAAQMTAPTTEFNSYYTTQTLSYYFGLDILSLYKPEELAAMARDPMNHNRELREISRMLYDTNATYTHTVDYLVAMLTLDKVVVTSGRSKTLKKKNREAATSVLKMIKDKEFIRDALWRGMVDGIGLTE